MADIKEMTFSFKPVYTSIDQYAVFEKNYKGPDTEFNVNSNIKFEYDLPTRTLKCQTSADVSQLENIVVTVMLTISYKLDEDTVRSLSHADKITLPAELIAYFGSKTYGAMRGVLIARLQSTAIRFMLPFVDIKQMVRSSLEIEQNLQNP